MNITPLSRNTILGSALTAGMVAIIACGLYFGLSGRSGTTSLGEQNILSASSRARTVRISETTPMTITFAEAMDESTLSGNVLLPENLAADMNFTEPHKLVLTPTEPLVMGAQYSVTILGGMKTKSGRPLMAEQEYNFVVSGPPTVLSRIPEPNGTEVDIATAITIVFDRPMVPLAAVHQQQEVQLDYLPVTITPETAGRWHWVGTTTLQFEPEAGLTPSTGYDVAVLPGMRSVNDEEVTEDWSWSFATTRLNVVSTNPSKEEGSAGPKTEIEVTFNQEVRAEDIRQLITFEESSASDSGSTIPLMVTQALMEDADGKKIPNPHGVLCIPGDPLILDAPFRLTVSKEARGVRGDLGMADDFVLSFRTAGPMTVTSSRYEQYGMVEIGFSNPLDAKTLSGRIIFNPPVPDWSVTKEDIKNWNGNTAVYFYPPIAPSTKYTVTILEGVSDFIGQSLDTPYNFSFTTDSLASRVFIHPDAKFGIFERGKPPVFYLNALNVSKLDVTAAKIPFGAFLEIQRQQQADWEFHPNLFGYEDAKTWTIPSEPTGDKWKITPFDIEERYGHSLAPGMYAIQVRGPEEHDYLNKIPVHEQFFNLTNLAVTLKFTGTHALVWVVDTQTGAPVEDAAIGFYALTGGVPVLTGTTDAEGFLETELDLMKFNLDSAEYYSTYSSPFFVTAEKDGDMAFVGSQWNTGIEPWSFGINDDFWHPGEGTQRVESFITTDRPLYRAGDTVHFKGIVRLRDANGTFTLPDTDQHRAKVTISDTRGNTIFDESLPISDFGSFTGSLALDSAVPLGYFNLGMQVVPEDGLARNYGGASFEVLAYRRPEYRVEASFTKEEYADGETALATVEGSYYFGAAMEGATVRWNARTNNYYFSKYTEDWYNFGISEPWCAGNCPSNTDPIASGEGLLDEAGKLTIGIPMDLAGFPVSQILTVETDLTDENNQMVSTSASVPVHKSLIYTGIKTKEWSVEPGGDVHVQLITLGTDATIVGNQSVTLSLYARTWNTVRTKSVDGEYYYENTPEDTFVSKTKAVTDATTGKAEVPVTIPRGGEFRIVAETTDAQGHTAQSEAYVYAWSNTYYNWPHTNSDRIEIVPDRPSYKIGDTATIILKSPYQGEGVTALITVEREQILERKVIPITSSAQPIEINITEEMLPNVFVSAVIIKPRIGETFNEFGLDTGAPRFKMGLTRLSVETERKRMTVAIETDKKTYLPRDTVEVTLTAKDYRGNPVEAELSLSVVDLSVLDLIGYWLPDLVSSFYYERGSGVQTAQMLLHIMERFKPGTKGGGGGEAAANTRNLFKDTAYWNPVIRTDKNGSATLSFTLPDNLTTWKLTALASSKESTFGSKAEEIIETKQVLVRSVRPRFAVQNDAVTIGAIVHNQTDKTQSFTVALGGNGFTLKEKGTRTVRIAAKERATVSFPVTINRRISSATFSLSAKSDGGSDILEETIPVFTAVTPQTVATSGVTQGSVIESVYVPSKEHAESTSVQATLSPSIAAYLTPGLTYLSTFPYECAEQMMSKIFPNIALSTLGGFEAFSFYDADDLRTETSLALERLYVYQHSDGGFGYWTDSRESYSHLTAYVTHGLITAQKAGYSVDTNVLDQAVGFLRGALVNPPWFENPLPPSTRAYILYVLATYGDRTESSLSNLFEKRDKLGITGKAYLAMAMELTGTSTSKKNAQTLIDTILRDIEISPRGAQFREKGEIGRWYGSMETDTTMTAIALQALVTTRPTDPLIERVIRYLLSVREDGHWDTTQSTAQTLFAFMDVMRQTGELQGDFEATLNLNGEEGLRQHFNAKNILTRANADLSENLKAGRENEIVIGKEGQGQIYYDLQMSYDWLDPLLPAAEEGIGIFRTIQPLDTKNPSLKVGTTHKVTLTMTVPANRHFVAVESPLPAGFEAMNFSFRTEKQSLQNLVNRTWWESGLYAFNHTEFRDDRVFLFADELPAGTYTYEYLVRATTPGTFHQRPAKIWEMYTPEVFGQTEGSVIEILP